MFDTAFHQTMPERAYTYALPKSLADEHGLRRYGAHGTSYRFLTRKAAQVTERRKMLHFLPAPAVDSAQNHVPHRDETAAPCCRGQG